jgi:hypothetical protein
MSIVLLSWGILKTAIQLLLSFMQTMQYVLRTGFGESAESYSGTSLSPNSGLGQGSGASPPAFLALSSLNVNAYRHLGHGAKICSSYVGHLFYLSAIMYVTGTDLLHWPDSAHLDPDDLIACVQQVTMDYGHLAQASGSILKEKSAWYILWTTYTSTGGQD